MRIVVDHVREHAAAAAHEAATLFSPGERRGNLAASRTCLGCDREVGAGLAIALLRGEAVVWRSSG